MTRARPQGDLDFPRAARRHAADRRTSLDAREDQHVSSHENPNLSLRRSGRPDGLPRLQDRPEQDRPEPGVPGQGVPGPRGDSAPGDSRRGGAAPAGGGPVVTAAYVVVARDRRTAVIQRGDDWRQTSRREWQPVGIRHAVPSSPRTVATEALCGADIREWHTFWELPFAPTSGSSCQRCLQVLHRAGARPRGSTPAPAGDEG
jgi:hypothetical protein